MVGSGVSVLVGGDVGVAGRRVRVGVGDAVGVGIGVLVEVGVGVRLGIGVRVGIGVLVGVLVGVGVTDGVSEGVSVGTSTKTGILLAAARTVSSATDGWRFPSPRRSQGATIIIRTTATIRTAATSKGRSQSC